MSENSAAPQLITQNVSENGPALWCWSDD